ncbi:MAG: DUF4345 family protein [Caulobacteraceae bacterium]|nr:DUF4345 family protein [Caulobacteraceae bacterium]
MERRALQLAILLAGCVPVLAGGMGALRGLAFVGDPAAAGADNHFRYLSGLLLGLGLLMWGCVPTIERRGAIVRVVTVIVVVGGLCRALGWAIAGNPGAMRWALLMELVVTPLICLWQGRIARLDRVAAAF